MSAMGQTETNRAPSHISARGPKADVSQAAGSSSEASSFSGVFERLRSRPRVAFRFWCP